MKRFPLLEKVVLVVALSALPATVWAQDQGVPDQNQDQTNQDQTYDPSRGVARISVINGDVSVRRGDSGEVSAAAINAPLMSQDRLLTSSSSRAEVQFDNANMARLGSNTELRMTDVERRKYIVELATGTMTYRVLRDSNATAEIDTPSVAVHPLSKGTYRIGVRDDGTTEITVRSGEAEIYTPKGSQTLKAGRTMLARGSASDPEFQEVAQIPYDDWDRWNEDRDHDLEASRSYQYVSPDIGGAEDLDNYGTWQQTDTYGQVWVPRVAPGWAPYRDGRWAWEDYYGWSWVSYDPWGWAPYHYGRWFNGSFGWAWYPGPIASPYYWSPALVGFFGFGGYGGFGGGFGFGFGNIGWCPLAPFEAFHPWWGRGFYGGGFNRGNIFNNRTTIVNNTNITNIYRNARVTNGVTAISAQNFGRAATTGNLVRVSANDLQRGNLVRGQVPVTPTNASLRFNDRQVNTRNFPQTGNRQFFSHATAAQVQRVPFAQQQRNMEQSARQAFHQPASGQGVQGSARSAAMARGVENGGAARTGPQQNGWNRAGENSRTAAPNGAVQQAGRTAESQTANGWRRVGTPNTPVNGVSGETRNGNNRVTSPARPNGSANGGWRRFNGPPTSANGLSGPSRIGQRQQLEQRGQGSFSAPANRSASPSSNAGNGGWRRFADAPAANRGTVQEGRPANRAPTGPSRDISGWSHFNGPAPRNSQPQYQPQPRSTSPRYEAPQSRGWNQSEPVRISPSIVHERPAPRSEYRAPSYSAPQYNPRTYSAPQYHAPSYSAPQYHASPSYGGGGGRSYAGGSSPSRSFSGGGGGRSSGGGGGGMRSTSGGGGGHRGR